MKELYIFILRNFFVNCEQQFIEYRILSNVTDISDITSSQHLTKYSPRLHLHNLYFHNKLNFQVFLLTTQQDQNNETEMKTQD